MIFLNVRYINITFLVIYMRYKFINYDIKCIISKIYDIVNDDEKKI